MIGTEVVHALVEDLVVLQVHLLEAIVRQSKLDALRSRVDARELLARLEPRLHGHVEALHACLERLGRKPPRVKERLGALLGVAAGWVDQVRSGREASRDLRDDFVLLSLVLVNYGMLSAAAARLDDPQTDDLAAEHIDALAPLLEDLMMIVPQIVEDEIDALAAG